MYKFFSIILLTVMLGFGGCGGSDNPSDGNSSGGNSSGGDGTQIDEKFGLEYKGLRFFSQNLPYSSYKLPQLSDNEFNALSDENKLLVADKLLSSLFFGYPLKELKQKIDSGNFISSIKDGLKEENNDIDRVESYIVDENYFSHPEFFNNEVTDILARLYSLENLDKHFLVDWISYILTQTIMFSPAYELASSHEPNTERVYNRLVRNLEEEAGMRYISYLHMISSDNWRRFRSPEDNGREMMEIFLQDFDDAKVPIAGKALQNWNLDRDNDTLVIGLHENTQALSLFGTTVYNGDDFYREMVKSNAFTEGTVNRLVDFFFTNQNNTKKTEISSLIVSSKPETWQDILVQIVFSKEFLLNSDHAKSAEELFFSLARKVEYKHYNRTFIHYSLALENMHQAAMKYKLGKLERVPLDTLSFMNYHKYIREQILIKAADSDKLNNYNEDATYGWKPSFLSEENFSLNQNNPKYSLNTFIDYLFQSTISRKAKFNELKLFHDHMLQTVDGQVEFIHRYNLLEVDRRASVAVVVLDYISRLSELYIFKKVQK